VTEIGSLSDLEIAIIDFERAWWLERGTEAKRDAIRRCLQVRPATYWAVLDHLLDTPAAMAYDPLLVRRLRKRRDVRRHGHFVAEAAADRKRNPR
jgi:hypothetical protein